MAVDRVAETIFPLFGYGDTPARLVVIVLAIAFIPSLIFAWVFEITPEGLKRRSGCCPRAVNYPGHRQKTGSNQSGHIGIGPGLLCFRQVCVGPGT